MYLSRSSAPNLAGYPLRVLQLPTLSKLLVIMTRKRHREDTRELRTTDSA